VSENPYPRGTFAHDYWEFDRARRELVIAIYEALGVPWVARQLARLARKLGLG